MMHFLEAFTTVLKALFFLLVCIFLLRALLRRRSRYNIKALLAAFKKYQSKAMAAEMYEQLPEINGIVECLSKGKVPKKEVAQYVIIKESDVQMRDRTLRVIVKYKIKGKKPARN